MYSCLTLSLFFFTVLDSVLTSTTITTNDIITNTPAVITNNKLGIAATSPTHSGNIDADVETPTTTTAAANIGTGHSHSTNVQHATTTVTTATKTGAAYTTIHTQLKQQQQQCIHPVKRADAATLLYNEKRTTPQQIITDTQTISSSSGFVEQETPLFQQSHSRHGNDRIESVDSSSSSSSSPCNSSNSQFVVVVEKDKTIKTTKTQPQVSNKKCTFNKNSSVVIKSTNQSVSVATNKYLKLSERNSQQKQQINSGSKMVAMQELLNDNFSFDDTSEELQYGPGIVSKLRCRYLSLALRQSASKQRPSLDNLRRATSLNNLLDEEDDADHASTVRKAWNTQNQSVNGEDKARTPDEYISSFQRKQFEQNENRCRTVQRGNDSLKRARSVEALMRYDQNAWQRDMIKDSAAQDSPLSPQIDVDEISAQETISSYSTTTRSNGTPTPSVPLQQDHHVTIEDKIINARERGEHKPKRLTSFMDDTERPPPDLVKHTLRIFEASANRRPKPATRHGNGDVATKVANYKTIISQEKPIIVFPKPPLSPKKPIVTPRISSPKHINGNRVPPTTNGHSVKPTTKNNGTSGLHSPVIGPQKKILTDTLCRSPSPLTVRIDTAYRTNKLESPLSPLQGVSRSVLSNNKSLIDSPLSSTSSSSPLSPGQQRFIRPDVQSPSSVDSQTKATNFDSPIIQLSKKMESLSVDSPAASVVYKSNHFSTDLNSDSDATAEDRDESDYDGSIDTPSRQISKSALANISKAGTTTEFKFGAKAVKSYLPAFNGSTSKKFVSTDDHNNSTPIIANVRQVGIIRPQVKAPPNNSSQNNLSPKHSSSLANSIKDINQQTTYEIASTPPAAPPSPLSSVGVGNNKDDQKPKRDNLLITNLMSANNIMLTTREIEKNLINKEKSEETNTKWSTQSQSVVVVPSASPIPQPLKNNLNSVTETSAILATSATPPTVPTIKSTTYQKPWQQPDIQNNTMVFNFSNRKDIPDYIENGGLVIRRKRELPKVSFLKLFYYAYLFLD